MKIIALKPMPIQLRLPFGVLRLDKRFTLEGCPKAPNPKNVQKQWRCNQQAENNLVSDLVNQLKASRFGPKPFQRKVYYGPMSVILANLLFADSHQKQLIYLRTTAYSNDIYVRCFDFLADEGLITTVIAAAEKDSETCSWAAADQELINLLNRYKARIVFNDKDKAPVEVRNKSGKVKRLTNRADILAAKALAAPVEAHNTAWLTHTATIDKKLVVPYLQRVCSRKVSLGGRFYGGYQQIPSADRARILFDGRQTVELDYRSLHLAILYSWVGRSLNGDPYQIEGYERDVVKAIALRLVNTENLLGLERTITLSANPESQAKFLAYKDKRKIFEIERAAGIKSTEPSKPKWVDSFIPEMPVGTDARALVQAFLQRHKPIKDLLGAKDIGLRLQAADSALMASVMELLYEQGIPVLPVHDSLICKQANKARVKLTMITKFLAKFGQKIEVK